MTPVEALKILGQATANFQGTRKDHEIIIEALKVLEAYLAAPSALHSPTFDPTE